MAKAEIIITQSPHGSSAPGIAKRALELYAVASEPVYLTNSTDGNVGAVVWEWTLIERPPGSTATLSGSATNQASFNPDAYGRYVVSLRVNNMGDNTPGYAITVIGVSFPSLGTASWGDELGDWDLPAFHEGSHANWTDYYGPANPYGAQRELYRILYQIRQHYAPLVTSLGEISVQLPGSLTQRSDQPTPSWADAGYLRMLNMGDLEFTDVYFYAIVFREGTAGVAKVRLYDATHTTPIAGSELTTTVGPVQLQSSALTVGSAPGEMRNDTPTVYKAQVAIDGGLPGTDYVNLYHAMLWFV